MFAVVIKRSSDAIIVIAKQFRLKEKRFKRREFICEDLCSSSEIRFSNLKNFLTLIYQTINKDFERTHEERSEIA